MTAAAAPLKLRLRPAIAKEAVVDGKTCAVELSPPFFDLNAYLSAEIVEDHPQHLCTASLAAGIDDDGRQKAFEAALERTLAEHPHRPELMEIPGASKARVMAFRGEAPWTTANAIRLSRGGFQTSDGVVLDRYLLAVPDTSTVLFMPAVFDDAERELGIAIEAAAHAVYKAASPRDRVFPGAFLAADGMLTPIRSYGQAPTLELNTEQSTRLDELPAPLRRPEGLPELPCATDEERRASLLRLVSRTFNTIGMLLEEGTVSPVGLDVESVDAAFLALGCSAVELPEGWAEAARDVLVEIEAPLLAALQAPAIPEVLSTAARWHVRGLRTLLNSTVRPSSLIDEPWRMGSAVHWSLLHVEQHALRFVDGEPAAPFDEDAAIASMAADVSAVRDGDGLARLPAAIADLHQAMDAASALLTGEGDLDRTIGDVLQTLYDLQRAHLDDPPESAAISRRIAQVGHRTFLAVAEASGTPAIELVCAAHLGKLRPRRPWWKFW